MPNRSVRFVARLFAGLTLTPLSAATMAQPPDLPAQAARAAWGFDRSDLVPHPAVRFGVLANGMRYAIMPNADPADGLAVRLRIDGGAGTETEREQGFAHLVEHVIFHGSANLPEGALLFMLPPQGLRQRSDFNAFTDYDETVYRLDLARSDACARETALMVMREIAGNLSFTPASVKSAKRAVLEELRGRDTVQDLLLSDQFALLLPGSAIARGAVAGTASSIGRASPAALRHFYERTYLPRRATLVVVGDVDPALVEAELIARFSDWAAREEVAARASSLASPANGIESRLFTHPDAPTSVTIAIVRPLANGDTGGGRGAAFLEQMASEMFNRRLARIAGQADAPFQSATSGIYDYFAAARIASLDVAARDRDWRKALASGERELGRAVAQGFSQAELDEQLAASRTALARGKPLRTSPALADAILDAAGRNYVFTRPPEGPADTAFLDAVNLADLNRAFAAAWSQPGRRIFVSHNRAIAGGETAIATAWREAAFTPALKANSVEGPPSASSD